MTFRYTLGQDTGTVTYDGALHADPVALQWVDAVVQSGGEVTGLPLMAPQPAGLGNDWQAFATIVAALAFYADTYTVEWPEQAELLGPSVII